MTTISFTSEQKQAIETVGCSLIVSAAAGSGKTAVLAQRCVYVICDAPLSHRCDIDQLVVLTFTDAAASEMRQRIIAALKARLENQPHDRRLREQIALSGGAHICTIHAFCQWLIRRCFNELEIDPSASLLDGDESNLLCREVLHDLFSSLYDRAVPPVGQDSVASFQQEKNDVNYDALSRGFIDLVDMYGLGQDAPIGSLILRLANFLSSLPDPENWLTQAASVQSQAPETIMLRLLEALQEEMQRQAAHALPLALHIETGDDIGLPYAESIRAYVKQLEDWILRLSSLHVDTPESSATTMEQFEQLRGEIESYEFLKATTRLAKDTPESLRHARDQANDQLKHVKQDLFGKRIKSRYGLFTVDEWRVGLEQTAPFVTTITDLARVFLQAYRDRKKQEALLDFSDLERFAFALLTCDGDAQKPSSIALDMQHRFVHVLVDEFQDINPIQQAILTMISREASTELDDNFFTVGDVKQSIYRFRLAEPALFTKRLHDFREATGTHQAIDLQKNFRSRSGVIDAVNLVFRSLMPDREGGIVYDNQAELRQGRDVATHPTLPVELHLLQRRFSEKESEQDTSITDHQSSRHWTYAAREAYVIGMRIKSMMETGALGSDEPLAYKDIAILLRAARVNGEQMATMLTAMGIPAHATAGGSLLETVEVRDVLAALRVLDNSQQDIPLASVMRSGILGQRFIADDLLALRNLDRTIPFHACVRTYIELGTDSALRERVKTFLQHVRKYRQAMRQRLLADVLWELFEEFGFLAYVGGRPQGEQRRANVLALHRITQDFSGFRRQGLHRFIRYIDSLIEAGSSIAIAPTGNHGEDVVQIMTIHQSKGLEFPVVFLAGLGTKFNLGDRQGRMIYERESKLGLRVIDKDKMIEYPSAAHHLVVEEIERSARDEETRILYVAMTRARDKLVMIGSTRELQDWQQLPTRTVPSAPISAHTLTTAATPLDWIYPTLAASPLDTIGHIASAPKDSQALFILQTYSAEQMQSWRAQAKVTTDDSSLRRAVTALEPLPSRQQRASEDEQLDKLIMRFDNSYPFLGATSIRAAIGASEVKRYFDDTRDAPSVTRESDGLLYREDHNIALTIPETVTAQDADAPLQRGIINHRVLQHLDFVNTRDSDGVHVELQRLCQAQLLNEKESSLVEVESIVWFLSTPLAEKIRSHNTAFQREYNFICTAPIDWFDPTIDAQPDDTVLVRGIVDGVLPDEQTVEIIDYKTDRISADKVGERAQYYRPQMMLYARAIQKLWDKPVRSCSLVFLSPRKIEVLTDL